jgi:hypothetical protein
MLTRMRRFLSQFLSKSRTIDNEPLNKLSLIVIIVVDIFILTNVFTGLDDISRWYLSPTQAYPCYSEWESYRGQTPNSKDYDIIRKSVSTNSQERGIREISLPSFRQTYQKDAKNNLGNIANTCLTYADFKDKVNIPENDRTIKSIDRKQSQITKLESISQNIQNQYDSTLLEKIAGQERTRSINQVSAEKAKQELESNSLKIATLKQENAQLKTVLVAKPESVNLITFLKDDGMFGEIKNGYRQASFWYPSIQFLFQFIFLLPLILMALLIHSFAQQRRYGLVALIAWHLLVIFSIPLLFKIFEFLQIGAIFKFISQIVYTLFGSLLFLISYVYILLVPLVGFGMIKVFQEFVFNPKVQTGKRVQKSQCIKCASKIRSADIYCPHCGCDQTIECQNCHHLTYQDLPYCNQCGHPQNSSN